MFEVDREATLAEKAEMLAGAGAIASPLAAPCAPTLRPAGRRRSARRGFDPTAPTAWLAEGLLFYLPIDVIEPVLATVVRLAAPAQPARLRHRQQGGPHVAVHEGLDRHAGRRRSAVDRDAGRSGRDARDAGLVGEASSQPGEPAANHGRWMLPVPPMRCRTLPHSWYVTAERA